MEAALTNVLIALAKARAEVQEARDRWAELKADFEEQNRDALNRLQAATIRSEQLDQQARASTLDLYGLDPTNKNPVPGVSVKLFTVCEYDPKIALAWAVSHRIALALDVKTFEGYAKVSSATNRLFADGLEGIVTIKEEPRAQIATDLARALKADVATPDR